MALIAHPGENFGYAAVEAMFAGIPVLVSNHVGISREVVADGAGVAVPLTIDAVANAIIDIFSNPERLAAKGRAAAASARRRYEIDIVARQMAMAYEDILTGRRSPGLSWSDE
jgi:glycosyltransferase involved in cell wall biosynthesis